MCCRADEDVSGADEVRETLIRKSFFLKTKAVMRQKENLK